MKKSNLIPLFMLLAFLMSTINIQAASKGKTPENPFTTKKELQDFVISRFRDESANNEIVNINVYTTMNIDYLNAIHTINDDYIRASTVNEIKINDETVRNENGIDVKHYLYFMRYNCTAVQDKWANSQVKTLVKSLVSPSDSAYTKARKLYEWVAENITYDDTYNKNIPTGSSYSAYGALKYRKATCQGYATLLYLMYKEAGIENRLVTGYTNKTLPHMWNIVKMSGKWYYCDVTGDSERRRAGYNYKYFLKSSIENTDVDKNDPVTKYFSGKIKPSTSDYDLYYVHVINGSGSGYYKAGTGVKIRANMPTGATFIRWKGSGVKSPKCKSNKKPTTTYKIFSDTTIKAYWTYKSISVKKGIYKIKSKTNSRYLQTAANNKKAGTKIISGAKSSKTAKWKIIKSGGYYYLQNTKTKLYLTRSGNELVQKVKRNATKWIIIKSSKGVYRFIHKGDAITVSGNSLIMREDINAPAQRFIFTK